MFFKKLGILLSGVILAKCDDGSLADYYTYHPLAKETPAATALKTDDFRINCQVADGTKIADLNKTENIYLTAGFSGLLPAFPENLNFDFFVDEKTFDLPDTIHYTITTVINDAVRYFDIDDTNSNVRSVVEKLRKEKGISDKITYFSITGRMKFPLNNSSNPQKLRLKFIAKEKEKVVKEVVNNYELKQPRLYKTRSRPFG